MQAAAAGQSIGMRRAVTHQATALATEIGNADVVSQMTRMLGLLVLGI
jgi:hypothetical protein